MAENQAQGRGRRAEQQQESETAANVADTQENRRLEHSRGGTTTRDDLLDQGVTMLPGDAREPVGPEDALGVGQKRGDYRERVLGEPHESVAVEYDEDPYVRDGDGNILDAKPTARLVAQKPRTEQIGDESRAKGGVTTSDES